MAKAETKTILKAYSTVESKLSTLPPEDGQLIFVYDKKKIILDNHGVRTVYEQIQTIETEEQRNDLLAPIDSFYFVIETSILWRYTNGHWNQITTSPQEQIDRIVAEGAKQIKEVQDKGAEVLQSIPEDFATQMETKLNKQQGVENKGKALIVGEDGNVVVGEVQGGGNGLVGEVLLADYTHQGNPEFHFADFDFATGIGTTTEPHGLTKKTEVLMCPNDWTILNPFENMLSMPIEWTMVEKLSDALALIPIDDTHLKVVASKEEAIINVNLEDVSNTNVDFTKFHFEKPISYVVKNLDNKINAKYIKVLASGYCSYTGIYRYRNVSVLFESGKTGAVKYINTLGFSRETMSPARNGVFLSEETLIDLRNNTKYYNKTLSYARRKGYSSLVNDPYRTVDDTWILTQSENVKAIKAYSTYSDVFAYMSNGTRIQFYALEGEYKNES